MAASVRKSLLLQTLGVNLFEGKTLNRTEVDTCLTSLFDCPIQVQFLLLAFGDLGRPLLR